MEKDYYKILGLSEDDKKLKGDEFNKLCKKKYHELALKLHPDRWANGTEQEKKDAEEKFISMIIKYVHKNNQPITELSLSLPELNIVRDLYQYILLLPLSIWSQAVEESQMTAILGLKPESKD